MLYGLLLTIYIISCLLLILLILIQKGKSSMGLGTLGGGNQMLFGGSGGQDVFQKATWVLGAIFIFGSLLLALLKSRQAQQLTYADMRPATQQTEQPVTPQSPQK